MRIAMLAPIAWRVPPRHYGPWERVVSLLTEGLVARGVEVTLFATADSLTRARLVGVCPRPYSEDPTIDPKVWECLHIAAVFEQAEAFDLIHNHFDFLPLSYSGLCARQCSRRFMASRPSALRQSTHTTMTGATMSLSATQTVIRVSPMLPRCIMAFRWQSSRYARSTARTCSFRPYPS